MIVHMHNHFYFRPKMFRRIHIVTAFSTWLNRGIDYIF